MKWIDLLEAATHDGAAFWFNPQNRDVIYNVSDHGGSVASQPHRFGITDNDQYKMSRSFDGQDQEDWSNLPDSLKYRSWNRDDDWSDAWEELGMIHGWVRGAFATSWNGGSSSAYISASNGERIWAGVKFIIDNDPGQFKVDVEIVSENGGLYVCLHPEDIRFFLKAGPKKADQFLTKAYAKKYG